MNLDKYLKLNLQYFADDEGESENNTQDDESVNDSDTQQDDENNPQGYTQAQVDSQISKAVDKALAKREKKHQQELEDAREKARKEAESYAKLTEKEKREKQISEREKQLEERERELNLRHLQNDVQADLKEKGLPSVFADSLILLDDNEKISESIQNIKKEFDNAVKEQVKEATRQSTPSNRGTNFAGKQTSSKSLQEFARENRIIQ